MLMEVSVIMDILVLQFYGYIGNIGEISMNIFFTNIGGAKIIKNS